ncbi:helix-turn-helix domain-containing protein [Streptomyces xanthophaeus]|uniref:helix-turn-helix domain-containing protein n=1 Tax=Streptomyces xanthophaeus TaxID=67385 RepID=UPI00368E7F33
MGRPEKPVDRTLVACGLLADLLRAARRTAGVTHRTLALRTGVSAATLKRAASGLTVPSEATVRKFLTACGATPDELARGCELRRAARAAQLGPAEGVAIPVALISTRAELRTALVALHRQAGSPSYRHMQDRAGQVWLALSSLSRILNRKMLPTSRGQMSAFLRGCGAPEEQRGHWLTAWERVTRPYRLPSTRLSPAAALNPRVVLRLTSGLGGLGAARPRPAAARSRRAQWGRDLLHLIESAEGIDTPTLARRAGLPADAAAHLLTWLTGQRLVTTYGGAHFPGPSLTPAAGPAPYEDLFATALGRMRDEAGAAVYFSRYLDGEVTVQAYADSARTPRVTEWVPFRTAAHASAIGKSLLAQLDPVSRTDHLARYPAVRLTDRTITAPHVLFPDLDRHGPDAPQFSLREYSVGEVCAALPLGLPGSPSTIALSLPVRRSRRLFPAAGLLARRIDDLLLALLLTPDRPAPTGAPPTIGRAS